MLLELQRGWWEGWPQPKFRGVCGPNEGRDLLWCSKSDYRIERRCQDPIAAPTQACSHLSTPTLHICHLPNLGLQSIFSLHWLFLEPHHGVGGAEL